MARILVADDDFDQLRLRKLLLEMGGHEVDTALCPSTALMQLQTGGAELVILDLRFANAEGRADSGEGLALIRGIRQSGCAAPLIVLSGWPEELYGTPEEAMVSRVMVKPVPTAVLLDAVDSVLRPALKHHGASQSD